MNPGIRALAVIKEWCSGGVVVSSPGSRQDDDLLSE
jgi:hypothetical protein